MDLIPQREHFSGPERLSPAWTLTKDRKTATCEVWSHEFGFELRLTVATELLQSEVCLRRKTWSRCKSDGARASR